MANTNYPSAGNSNENRPANNNTTRNVLIGLLAVGLLGTWGYVLYDKNKTTQEIQVKSAEVTSATSARDSVQTIYNEALTRLDSLVGTNNNLNGQLNERQTEIVKLKNQINSIMRNKNASAADLSRARNLISQLNGKINNLEMEVARLMGENQQLATSNVVLTGEKAQLQTDLQTTTTQKEELAAKVDVGSTFAASNIAIKGIDEKGNGKEKETDKAKKVNKLVVSFDVENRIAPSGPADMYVIVTGPDGQIISNPSMGSGTLTTRTEGDRPFTYKAGIEYEQGTRKTVSVPLRQDKFQVGDYKIEIYQNGFKIGEGTRNLRKSGLFGL
ncbi:MAG TPA: hypothetical protein VER36_11770 [Flavisolibacter sp.]|nr:hypothetical protein [Flavisolibacter sp.]